MTFTPQTCAADFGKRLHGLYRMLLVIALLLFCWLQTATAAERRQFNLSADKAENSLRQLSIQSGVEVVFASGVAAGVETKPVKGEYEPLEAARLMLAGTGLTVRQDEKTGALTVTREATPEAEREPRRAAREPAAPRFPDMGADDIDEVVRLSPFEVSAKADRGYGSAQAAGATRIALPVSEVAGHVATVNQELIQDTAGTLLGDVAKYISGVTYSNDTGQGSVVVRGSYSRGGSLIEDGLPSSAIAGGSAGAALIDMNIYDRIEVIKGPNGILYGAHALGGLLNRVTKKPLPVARTVVTASAGSYDTIVANVDSTGPVPGSDGRLLYRLIATEQQGEGPNGEENDLRAITPQLEYRPTADSTFRLMFSRVFGTVPRNTSTFNDPSGQPHFLWDATLPQQVTDEVYRETEFNEITFTFNQSFDVFGSHWNMNLVGRYGDVETNWLLDQTVGAVTARDAAGASLGQLSQVPAGAPIASVRTANWFRRLFIAHDQRWLANLDFTGTFPVGPTEHVFFTGLQVTGGNEEDVRYSYTPPAIAGGYEVWPNPVFPALPDAAEIATPARRITPSNFIRNNPVLGWTVQDNIRLWGGRVIGTAGLRWDKGGGSTTRALATGALTEAASFDVWTPKFGVIVKPLPGAAIFYNKTQTYEITRTIDTRLASPTFGERFPNRDGKIDEVGVKLELWDNRLIATASYFDIRLTNGLASVNDDDFGTVTGLPRGGYSIPAGELTTKGREIDLAVIPFEGLQCILGWSRLDARTEAGLRVGNAVAGQTFSALARYSLPKSVLDGLSVGVGVNRIEDRVISNADLRAIPDYTLTEMFVTYRRAQWEVQLNVNNLTDENYLVSPPAILGMPRTYKVRFRYTF